MSEHVEKIHRVVEWLVESNQVYDHSAEVIFSNHLPTPPPSCHNMEDGSPRKRPRATDNDLERTPTPGSSVNSLAYRLPQPPVLPHTYTRSESSRTSSRTSNRSSSPTKSIKKFRLQALEKPVLYEDLDEDVGKQLPYDVQELHKRIDEIVVLRSAFLPGSIREEVCSALGRQVPDSWFTAPQPSDDRDKALEELRQLKGIVLESRRSRELGRGESGLNWKVHEPFLKLALEQYDGMVESEPATDARILPAFIPMTEGTKIPTESKIDIAIVLSPTATGGDKHLADSIRRAVMSEPDGKKSSSHTNYQPLNFRPPATFIETKATGSADEGRTQLGIFVAAQNLRFSSFICRRYSTLEGDKRPVVLTLPQILTSELDWKLYYCCDRRDRLDMVGDVQIGDTKNMLGALTLLAVTREIAKYIAVQFRLWIEDLFRYDE